MARVPGGRLAGFAAVTVPALLIGSTIVPSAAQPPPGATLPPPLFQPSTRAVSTWRDEAAAHLVLTADQKAAFRATGAAPRVARCVKLNNYWCIKAAGWDGEIAADGEGHVAFASAVEGAAVAALLLKRYYVDFDKHTAIAIISRWAPALCQGRPSVLVAGRRPPSATRPPAPNGLGHTRHARWPTIVPGLGTTKRPMTLDALLMSSPNAPPSRSMLGMPRGNITRSAVQIGSVSSCGFDSARIAAYAAKAAEGITPGPDGDLALFTPDGAPTGNLAIMLANMARVEIGPFTAAPSLISEGIAQAFRAGRNPDKS